MFSGLYSIPRHAPFLASLAAGLLAATAASPLALANTLLLLPNQRSIRALRAVFLNKVTDVSGNGAAALPRMLTFGDLTDDDVTLSLDTLFDGEPLPPPVSPHERLLHLSRFVQARDPSLNSVQAVALARDLGNLFNELALYETDPGKLATLVTQADYAAHWEQTLKFTSVVTQLWPDYLRSIGRSDPALYRTAALQRLADSWQSNHPAHPVVMAGVARAEPVLMRLAKAVLANPQGAVVLPGFDTTLPDDIWANLDAPSLGEGGSRNLAHPDVLVRDVILQLGPARRAVQSWPHTPPPTYEQQARADWVNLAMLPAAYTKNWAQQAAKAITPACLEGVSCITADDETHEAAIVALAIRKALETPNQTVSLLTADRTLARRVASLLPRWGIVADDSSGLPFLVSRLCIFLQLVGKAAAPDATTVDLLALLKHPLSMLDVDTDKVEVGVFRGKYPAAGFAGLLAHLHDANESALADALTAAVGPLALVLEKPHASAATLLRAHMQAAESLAGAERLWFGAEGEVASQALSGILESIPADTVVTSADYLPWLMQLLSTLSVRVPYGQHPRVTIHGLIEARLQQADVMIIAGLNEGVWPALPAANPWLNRVMRQQLGLPSPDEVIAQQAHDAVTALMAPAVMMVRSARRDGAPTVPARWWHRLHAVLAPSGLNKTLLATEKAWRDWAHQLDEPALQPTPASVAAPPAPVPPLTARPRTLSVTAVETWMRNPYGLYAKEILKLRKLADLTDTPGAAERGQFIHAALADFSKRVGVRQLAPADWQTLEECGKAALAPYSHLPGVKTFWWPWFLDVARWWWGMESEQRPQRMPCVIEQRGEHTWQSWHGGPFTLHGKADRIDVAADAVIVLDYKSGTPPTQKRVTLGAAPQLSLEALLVRRGGFAGVPARGNMTGEYWHLAGRQEKCDVSLRTLPVEEAEAGLRALVEVFSDAAVPYVAMPLPPRQRSMDDYDHLARTAAWLVGDTDEDSA